MSELDPRVEQELRAALATVAKRGDLLTLERLQSAYATFRDSFGPDRLASMDGEALLHAMHSHGTRDSLVYWLEFKNDEEFPSTRLGSISGGSAHKFGLFRRRETGQWVKGSPMGETDITEAEAVAVARAHRDQLLAGVTVLEKLPATTSDAAYQSLQDSLGKAAPDISNSAWAHKYWSILFPEKLDDYHNERYQRYHLIRLLQLPPKGQGLYVCAARYLRLVALLKWPVNHLSAAINERHGRPTGYWRVGTRLGEKNSIWAAMREGGYAAIGWEALGDLSALGTGAEFRGAVRAALEKQYPGDPRLMGKKANEIRNFVTEMAEGDVVLAADGERVLALGRVTGPYRFEPTEPTGAPHRRAVEWVTTEPWKLPVTEGLRTTFYRLRKDERNLLETERRLLDAGRTTLLADLEGIPGRVQKILERKGQAILYGPPGTGKTYWARQTALDLAALGAFRRRFQELTSAQKARIEGTEDAPGLVRCCTFHPAYGYEDFIEGYRPGESKGQLAFTLKPGIFRAICEAARGKPEKYVLLIDEINRGDIPRIFGELLTLLELDKRDTPVRLPLSGDGFSVPANLYVLGTMNTADRSIALLDTALRRRFGFVELMPDVGVLGNASVGGSIPLGPWLSALNERIRAHLGRDGRNLQIGHAYLLEGGKPVADFDRFVRILADDVVPLVEEYCYEDYPALTQILGSGLVDGVRQRIRKELFAPAHREELVQALLAPAPEVVTSPDAVGPAESEDEGEEDGEEGVAEGDDK